MSCGIPLQTVALGIHLTGPFSLMLKPCPETAGTLPGKHLETIDLPQGMQMLLPGLAPRRVWQNIIASQTQLSCDETQRLFWDHLIR